jgi:hypothetical protein
VDFKLSVSFFKKIKIYIVIKIIILKTHLSCRSSVFKKKTFRGK